MKFQIGQKVLCIDDHFNYGASRLKKGLIYTINGFYICPCGSHQVTLVEIPDMTSMRCKCNRTFIRMQSYYNWRFVPLEFFGNYDEQSKKLVNAEEFSFQSEELQKELTSTTSKHEINY